LDAFGRRTEVYKKCTVCGKVRVSRIEGWWEALELTDEPVRDW